MQVILSSQCESLTGTLGRGFGYYIKRAPSKQGVNYFSQRSKHNNVPPDGHWRFILACAELAKSKLHITDIKVNWMELSDALYEARKFQANGQVRANAVDKGKIEYNAQDIVNLKFTFNL